MVTLLIPAAGLSTRYGLKRPKFLLQHPLGRTMLAEGLTRLNFEGISRVLVVSLATYFDDLNVGAIEKELAETTGTDSKLLLLEEPTASMVETISEGIRAIGEDGPIIIKDCDNRIGADVPAGDNFVVYGDASRFPDVRLASKSFVTKDANGFVTSVVEKRIVSGSFNTGLIGFRRASEFLATAEKNRASGNEYVSNIVESLLDAGEYFEAVEAREYFDWGTLNEWREHCSKFATLFVDIDGVIGINEHPHAVTGGWASLRAIQPNLDAILARALSGSTRVVFTTSRTERYRAELSARLAESGFESFDLIMGLPHARRYLVNDYAETNLYPTAVAINIPRNSEQLPEMLPQFIHYERHDG